MGSFLCILGALRQGAPPFHFLTPPFVSLPPPQDVEELLKFLRPLHEGTLVLVASYDDPATK